MFVRLPSVITSKVGKKLASFLSTPAPSHLPLSQYVTPVIELGDQSAFDDMFMLCFTGSEGVAGFHYAVASAPVISPDELMLVYGLSFSTGVASISRIYVEVDGIVHVVWADPATGVTARQFGCANWFSPWPFGGASLGERGWRVAFWNTVAVDVAIVFFGRRVKKL